MTEPRSDHDALLVLVRGGADVEDAALTLGIDTERVAELVTERELQEAMAAARVNVDTGQRKARPGEWERRREPMAIALPGEPMKCTAKRTNGKPCSAWAIKGLAVCRTHGGSTQRSKGAAARRLAVHSIGAELARLKVPTDIDPVDAIRQVIKADWAQVLLYEGLQRHAQVQGAGEHEWVTLYHEALDRLAKHSEMAIRAGLKEREVQVAEMEAAVLASVIAAMIDDGELGLSPPQRLRARHVAARHLRALPSAG